MNVQRPSTLIAIALVAGTLSFSIVDAQTQAPAPPAPAAAGQGPGAPGAGPGRGGGGGGPIVIGEPAPVPAAVAIPRPTEAERAAVNATVQSFINSDQSPTAPLLKKFESLLMLQPARLNVAATFTQTAQRRGPRHEGFVEIARQGNIRCQWIG